MFTHNILEFREKIEKLISPKNVDLINLNKTKSFLVNNNIFSKGVLIYENKNGLFDKKQMEVWFDYQDFKHYYKEEKELIEQKIEAL